MKVTYWIADRIDDSHVYSFRAKTKRELFKMLLNNAEFKNILFGKPRKVTLEYKDAFDLVVQLRSEDGGEGCPNTTDWRRQTTDEDE